MSLFTHNEPYQIFLEKATSLEDALKRLQSSVLFNTEWDAENWKPYMLETAIAIAQKWKRGFD